jgi:hypothetical protein
MPNIPGACPGQVGLVEDEARVALGAKVVAELAVRGGADAHPQARATDLDNVIDGRGARVGG